MSSESWQSTLSALAARDDYSHTDIHTIIGDASHADAKAFAAHMHDRGLAHIIKGRHTASAKALMKAAYTAVTRDGTRNIYIIFIEPQTKGLKLGQVFMAIESIKDGFLHRSGREWKQIRTDERTVIAFTAHKPRSKFLGPSEKWRMWSIEDGELKQYTTKEEGTQSNT